MPLFINRDVQVEGDALKQVEVLLSSRFEGHCDLIVRIGGHLVQFPPGCMQTLYLLTCPEAVAAMLYDMVSNPQRE